MPFQTALKYHNAANFVKLTAVESTQNQQRVATQPLGQLGPGSTTVK